MINPYDLVNRVYNDWHPHVRPNVPKELSFTFEDELNSIKQYIQNKDYSTALPIVKTMIKGFNPDNYKDKPWSRHAERVLGDLNELEKSLNQMLN